jgi:hypothetical protein
MAHQQATRIRCILCDSPRVQSARRRRWPPNQEVRDVPTWVGRLAADPDALVSAARKFGGSVVWNFNASSGTLEAPLGNPRRNLDISRGTKTMAKSVPVIALSVGRFEISTNAGHAAACTPDTRSGSGVYSPRSRHSSSAVWLSATTAVDRCRRRSVEPTGDAWVNMRTRLRGSEGIPGFRVRSSEFLATAASAVTYGHRDNTSSASAVSICKLYRR